MREGAQGRRTFGEGIQEFCFGQGNLEMTMWVLEHIETLLKVEMLN